MIIGIGTDIVEKQRVSKAVKNSEYFCRKVYSPKERQLIKERKNPAGLLAMNFAGKEAVSKAFGTGIRSDIRLCDIEILRDELGAPYVILHGGAKKYARERGIEKIHISLSDTREEYAVAYVIAEGKVVGECST